MESWGEVRLVGFEADAWRLRFIGLARSLGCVEVCRWFCGLWVIGLSAPFSFVSRGCMLTALPSVGSAGVWSAFRGSIALSSSTVEVEPLFSVSGPSFGGL